MAEVTGQRIVSFAESTSPGTLDYLATDNATNGNRKVSYLTLSEKILDKLSSKTFSLDGSNKTVLEALAELYQADDVLNARIDNIITPSGQASLSELIDVRTNWLGQTFVSAGEAVRVSDKLNGGFLPFSYTSEVERTEAQVTISAGFIDVQNYKGGRIIVATVAGASLVPYSGQSEAIGLNNSPTMDGGFFLEHDDKPGATHPISQYLDNYHEETLEVYVANTISKLLVSFSIPEDFEYRYIGIGYISDSSISGIDLNYFYPYGAKSGISLKFVDPNSDGNIEIS